MDPGPGRIRQQGAARAIALGVGGLLAYAACDPIQPAPAPDAPLNECPAHPCDAYKQEGAPPACNGEMCLVGARLTNTLVVSPSATSSYAPNEDVVITPQYLSELLAAETQKIPASCDAFGPDAGAVPPLCTCSPQNNCLVLPGNGRSQGALKISHALALQRWPPDGLRAPDGDPYTSMPARVTFRPLFSSDGQSFEEAHLLGLPLADIEARGATFALLSPGPNNHPPTGYDVLLQSGPKALGVGYYVRRVEPLPPFDSAFPPVVGQVNVLGGQHAADFSAVTVEVDGLDPDASGLRKFRFASLGPDLTGWRAYLASQTTRERLSTLATLPGPAGGEVVLQTAIGLGTGVAVTNLANQALVLEPPAGRPLPTYTVENISGAIFTDHTIPALPAPVTLSGRVEVDAQGRAARIVFESDENSGISGSAYATLLSYRTVALTDASGNYSVTLPPGNYTAWVVPTARDAAVTPIASLVGLDLVQQGRTLALGRPTTLRGKVMVTDGRAVGGADIVLVPAATQAVGTASWALPRAAAAKTARDGRFEVAVDPGTYDLTVLPAPGTRLPWVVSTSRTVGHGSVELEPLLVPAPVRVALTLRDPAGNALAGALVRAYAPSARQPAGGARRPVYEVGRAWTNANGRFEMFLAGPPS